MFQRFFKDILEETMLGVFEEVWRILEKVPEALEDNTLYLRMFQRSLMSFSVVIWRFQVSYNIFEQAWMVLDWVSRVLQEVSEVFEEPQVPLGRVSCMILGVFQGFFRGILKRVRWELLRTFEGSLRKLPEVLEENYIILEDVPKIIALVFCSPLEVPGFLQKGRCLWGGQNGPW